MPKIITGFIWASVQRFGTMVTTFIANVVLARMLTPSDYGAIGMLMIFIVISNTFIDGGFGSALIQKKEPTQTDYSTIFYWNLFLSILLYIILYFCAPLIADFYNLSLLSTLLRVQGVVLIINSLGIIQSNQLRKQLKFKKLALAALISSLLSVIVAIIMAYNGWGVWSLVAQQILFSSFSLCLYWFYNRWVPLLVFSKKSFIGLFSFGFFILSSTLLNNFCNNIQGLIIGKFFSPTIMGLYSQAAKFAGEASNSLALVVEQVSYPVLVKVQNDRIVLINMIRKFLLSLAYFCFPLMLLLIIIAHPLIKFLYSENWVGCVPYFQILCVSGLAICLQGVTYNAIAAIGKSRVLFNWTIVKRVLGISYLFIGLIWGVYGLLWGMVLGSYTYYIINAYLVSKYIGYKLKRQFFDLLPIILLSCLPLALVYVIEPFFQIEQFNIEIILGVFYMSLYIIGSYLFHIESMELFKKLVLDIIKRKR